MASYEKIILTSGAVIYICAVIGMLVHFLYLGGGVRSACEVDNLTAIYEQIV
jgi:hypothetical protein